MKMYKIALALFVCIALTVATQVPAFALTSEQGASLTGTHANATDPDEQQPTFLAGPSHIAIGEGAHAYLNDPNASNGSSFDQPSNNVLGPSVREMQLGRHN